MRYSRQTMIPEIGPAGQERLQRSSALIVGLGGLGSPVALYLAAAGVGRLGLCDADTVDLSNLQRQVLYTEADVGRPKAVCAARRLQALSSATTFDVWPHRFEGALADTLTAGYDLIVDCTDNFATRFLIDDACRRHRRPWVHGSIGGFYGQVAAFVPGGSGLADLLADRDDLCSRPAARDGVLGAVPGVIGSLQAVEALKLLSGAESVATLASRLLTIDLKTMQISIIDI